MVKTSPSEGEIQVPPDSARRCSNGYLARYVALTMEASESVWCMAVYLTLRGWGQVAKLGEIDGNARTRKVLPLSNIKITGMQDRADAIITRPTPTLN